MIKRIRSVIIVYDLKQSRHAIEVSGFFRIIGVLAEEYKVLEQESSKLINFKEFDVVLNLSNKIDIEDLSANIIIHVEMKDDNVVAHILEKFESILEEKEILNIWKKIAKVYKDNNIALSDYNAEYYFFNKDIAEKSYVAFVETYVGFIELTSDSNISVIQKLYVTYAIGYCIRRMHELADVLHYNKMYNIDKILQSLDGVLEADPDFKSVYLLKAYLSDTDELLSIDSYHYCKKFLSIDNNEDKMYSYRIYYRLGRYYEKNFMDWEKAFEYYKKANNLKIDDFKSLYKIGCYFKMNKNYKESKKVFLQTVEILNKSRQEGYVQPVEFLYMYKVKFLLGKICILENFNKEAIKYFEEADKLLQEKSVDVPFYKDFYKEDAESYYDIIKNRVPVDSAKLNQEYLEIIEKY